MSQKLIRQLESHSPSCCWLQSYEGKQVHADDEDLSSSEELARAATGVAMDRARAFTHWHGLAPTLEEEVATSDSMGQGDAVKEPNWFCESL